MRGLTIRLGLAQTLGWASSYYLAAILGEGMAASLSVPLSTIYAVVSLALVVCALVGPAAGKWVDRHGGRTVLCASSLVFAIGLALMSQATHLAVFVVAWLLVGLAMGFGLYDTAFAALVRIKGAAARPAITGITLLGGFASTVGWPLSAWAQAEWGWQGACLLWAGLHALVGLPLNAMLPREAATQQHATPAPAPTASASTVPAAGPPLLPMLLVSLVFAITWFVSTAMASHMPRLLEMRGASAADALLAGMLLGPAQVAGRLLEYGALRVVHPLLSARLAACTHPLGALLLALGGPGMAPMFGLMHGAGNGILTVAKGTLPLALFGSRGYGQRLGWLMLPGRLAQAAAPLGFGLAMDGLGGDAIWLTAGLTALSLLALLMLSKPAHPPD